MITYTCDVCGAPGKPIRPLVKIDSGIATIKSGNRRVVADIQISTLAADGDREATPDLCDNCLRDVLKELLNTTVKQS